ncbi:MAG: FAD-binding and (Fe-S)-binding domain-containing protein [Nitrospirota bacterium]
MHKRADLDTIELEAELQANLHGEVRFDDGSRALYATDGSNYRQTPIGVVLPKSTQDVITAIAIARKHEVPITSRGGGTSLAGQCCNAAIIIDMSKYLHRVLHIDVEKKLARVEPGTILDDLRHAAEKHGLTFGPDPATHNHCTLGGMIGNNSCGIHSVMAAFHGNGARTSDNVHDLEILTYTGERMRVGATSDEELESIIRGGGHRGEIYRKLRELRDTYASAIREKFPNIPRRVSGYNLDELLPENGFNVARALSGTEGTCVTVLEATLCLLDNPKARTLLVLGYPDVYAAGDHAPEIMQHKPIGLEGIDDVLIGYMKKTGLHPGDLRLLPEGKGFLMAEFGGDTKQDADEKARAVMTALKTKHNAPHMKLFDSQWEESKVWEVRESGLGATAFVPGLDDTWPGWEDSAVPPNRVGPYLRDLRKLFHKYDYNASLYGHFGQGCIHCRIPFDLYTAAGIKKYRAFVDEAADLVLSYGGSLSGEHGDGQSRAELLPKMYGPQIMEAFRTFKSIWDPRWKMNPGKVIGAHAITENLRLGSDYNPWQPPTYFQFPSDKGSFARATLRCVGVGKCRRLEGGTMCPSFMVTREEQDTTRGRAHLLFEMLRGETIGKNGWRDESVKDALDLCLACKGCKGDCPVNVDMATYKAEFLAHYYEGRLRPLHAFAFGLIHIWSQFAQISPSLVNFMNRAPLISNFVKSVIGIAPQREIPGFAAESFKRWFARRPMYNRNKQRVILWPDTFNNYFHPATAKAAVEVLESAGFQVAVPRQDLCCGRPLYDCGMLGTARRWVLQILHSLAEEIEAGVPIVGLEPSCTAVFRDEVYELFPQNENARRVKQQTFTLPEFLDKYAPGYRVPKLERKVLVHGHCHHKAVMKLDAEKKLLKKMGLNYELIESGCCGMAGAFGFEADHYDVSIACGERVLLPAVREAGKDTIILADGFSCREQVRQCTDRVPLHIAELLKMAMDEGPRGPAGNHPERNYITRPAPPASAAKILSILAVATVAVAAAAGFFSKRKR